MQRFVTRYDKSVGKVDGKCGFVADSGLAQGMHYSTRCTNFFQTLKEKQNA